MNSGKYSEMSFYVVLPSNSCSSTRPYNSANSFVIDIDASLDGKWETSLVEYSITNKHVDDSSCRRFINVFQKDDKSTFWFNKYTLPKSLSVLQTRMNTFCSHLFEDFKINQNDLVEFEISNTVDKIVFEKMFAYELGFKEVTFIPKKQYTSQFEPKIAHSIGTIDVLTNITEPIRVGRDCIQLLRSISLDPDDEIIHKVVDIPFYIPVLASYINNIEIQLVDKKGKLIQFANDSTTIITLHFQKRND